MKIKDKRDVTDKLELANPWLVTLLGKAFLEVPVHFRFDYELRVTAEGIRVLQRDPDEGKIG